MYKLESRYHSQKHTSATFHVVNDDTDDYDDGDDDFWNRI